MDHKQISKSAKAKMPSMEVLARECVDELLPDPKDPDLKSKFSELVAGVQELAYAKYLQHEAKACSTALREALEAQLQPNASGAEVIDLICENTYELDRVFLSLAQSRKSRAGSTFEKVMDRLLVATGYPYDSQPDLGESRPDYVLPSLAYYRLHATDCILLTCKRTLRERWRQIVTEGTAGRFYLATIDDKLSVAELDRMKDRRVTVVVPQALKTTRYASSLNVISFEEFLIHHLDPAMARWRAAGAL